VKGLQLLLAMFFLFVLAGQWLFWPVDPPEPDNRETGTNENTGTVSNTQLSEEPRNLAPLAEYGEIGERPLFFEGRRVPDEPILPDRTPQEVIKKQALNVGLTGIMFIDDVRYALVKDAASKSTQRLKVGDDFQGWKVVEIAEDKIVMSSGNGTEEIRLWEYKAVPPPRKSARPAKRKAGTTRRAGKRPIRTRREPLKK